LNSRAYRSLELGSHYAAVLIVGAVMRREDDQDLILYQRLKDILRVVSHCLIQTAKSGEGIGSAKVEQIGHFQICCEGVEICGEGSEVVKRNGLLILVDFDEGVSEA
jgi:hypothetical protein